MMGSVYMMRLTLGTVQLGMNYGIHGAGRPSIERSFAMLKRAISLGVCALDTAAAYGEAEQVIGAFVKAEPDIISNIEIISKLPASSINSIMNFEQMQSSSAAQARESLDRLGVPKLADLLLHDADLIFVPDAVRAIAHLKDIGITDRIGVSVYTPEQALRALEYEEIDSIQIPCNAMDWRFEKSGLIDRAMDRGMILYARSSLLQGLLTMEPEELPDKMSFASSYLRSFKEIAARHDLSPLAAAVKAAAFRRGITHIVFGADSEKQIEEYIAATREECDSVLLEEFETAFRDAPERLLRPDLW